MHHAFGSGGVENPDKPEVYSRPLVDGVGPEALVQTRVLTVTEIDWHHKRAGSGLRLGSDRANTPGNVIPGMAC
ncbi:hypothetical protein CGGC5_v005355 [Colletotrichum fructicola Nara gc5]|uniref:Uncharacterized protein n=1 Tax=Colletotrichum fructicola (strain Nara gc5) TaxID=1213859 RepID=A0A7J6J9Y6_COLFN|nr:hypothetical protein CGGC5_v005355 [Colletotrichum fructicola Nara gc5]